MTAIRRPKPYAASLINRHPHGATLGIAVAGIVLLGAMMPLPIQRSVPIVRITPISKMAPASPSTPSALVAALPVPDTALPALPADVALARNAAIPVSTLPNPKATPFALAGGDAASHARALDCLTAAIYYEAGGEGDAGQAAVAQVVLNRVRNPAYPKTVCAVVFDGTADRVGTGNGVSGAGGCQFTFTCDGAMGRAPSPAGWRRARSAAAAALVGAVAPAVGWSTHYHTQWVAPAWAPTLIKTAVIGAHIFYRPPARIAIAHYAGVEPEIAQMAPLSSVPMTIAPTAVVATASGAVAPPAAATEPAAPVTGQLAVVLPDA